MKYLRRLYLERNSSWRELMAPRLFFLIRSTASSYFMPSSMRAVATSTGALGEGQGGPRLARAGSGPVSDLPRPVTQWTPTQVPGVPLNSVFTRESHRSMISWVGAEPSGKESSDTATPLLLRSAVW